MTTKEELFDLKKEIEELEEKFKNNELKEEDIKKLDQFLLLYNTEEIRMLKTKIEDKIVITSYSIHYTKLYDCLEKLFLKLRLMI